MSLPHVEVLAHTQQRSRLARVSINNNAKTEPSPARSTHLCRSSTCSGRKHHPRQRCAPHKLPVAPIAASQIPIAPADPGAPSPRLPSLAAFQRRPGRARVKVSEGPASETLHTCGHPCRTKLTKGVFADCAIHHSSFARVLSEAAKCAIWSAWALRKAGRPMRRSI